MITETQDQKRLIRIVARQPCGEVAVVLRRHSLATNVFVGLRRISQRRPVRCQIGPVDAPPGKMIGREVHEHEDRRRRRRLTRKHLQGLVEIELVGLPVFIDTHIRHVHELADAGPLLEPARTEEASIGRIEREGLVSAALQRSRQSTRDTASGDSCDVKLQIAERSRRHAGQDIEFGVPGRASGRLRDHGPLPAVNGPEVVGVPWRHFDARRGGDIEARLVEQHDDMRPPCSGVAFFAGRQRRPAGGVRSRGQGKQAACRWIGLDPSCRSQPRYRHHARAREIRNMIDALERLPCLLGRRDRHR